MEDRLVPQLFVSQGPVCSGSREERDRVVSPLQMHAHMLLVSQETLGSRSVLHMADVFWACLLTCGDTVSTHREC